MTLSIIKKQKHQQLKLSLPLSVLCLLSTSLPINANAQSNAFQRVEPAITSIILNEDTSNDIAVEPDFGLDPNLAPWENFDLIDWGLDSPALRNSAATSGSDFERGTRIDEVDFIALRDQNEDFAEAQAQFFGSGTQEDSSPYFFTGPDGGMVFKSPVNGGRTSSGARFPRSELREYVRAGVTRRDNGNGGTEGISLSGANENNWVLGYQPSALILDCLLYTSPSPRD